MHKSLGVTNSVSYNYDYLAVMSFKSDREEEIFEALLNEGIEPVEFECEEENITVSVNPTDHNKVKDVLEKIVPDIDYDLDEVGMFAKDLVTLSGEDLELFNRLYSMLEDIDDVTAIYHNVNLD